MKRKATSTKEQIETKMLKRAALLENAFCIKITNSTNVASIIIIFSIIPDNIVGLVKILTNLKYILSRSSMPKLLGQNLK